MPKHWSDISPDPNCQEVRDFRAQVITSAWAEPVYNRIEYLAELAKGKSVLDIGVVDHWVEHRSAEEWLHGAIAKSAAKCLGVDVLESEVTKLQAKGFNVMLRDVTANPLDQQFDLMVCGELIEHLGNPGGLFKAAAKMLKPGGRMVLTTPNPFFRGRLIDSIEGRMRESVDHVMYLFPSGIAEFAEREGLKLDRFRGVISESYKQIRKGLKLKFARMRHGNSAVDQFCRTYIYEVVKPA